MYQMGIFHGFINTEAQVSFIPGDPTKFKLGITLFLEKLGNMKQGGGERYVSP